MFNWQIDYRVKYHITFHHNNGRSEVMNASLIVEAGSLKEAEEIIIHQYKHNDVPLTAFPDGWHREIKNKKFEIDEIIKAWEYCYWGVPKVFLKSEFKNSRKRGFLYTRHHPKSGAPKELV